MSQIGFTVEVPEGSIAYVCKEKTCGKVFYIAPDEAKWYENNGLALPLRCPECRKRRKDERNGRK